MGKSKRRHVLVWATLWPWLASPFLFVSIHSVARWLAGGEAEPLLDYVLMSLSLLVLLPVGALAIMLVSLAAKGPTETWLDVVTFAIVSAGACGGLLTLIDWNEDYFTRPGIQGFATMAGVTVGALYGAAVGMICFRLAGRER